MVIVACLALNLFNPAFAFVDGMEGEGGLGARRRAKKQRKAGVEEVSGSGSGSASDVDRVTKREAV